MNSSKWPSTEQSAEKVRGGGDVRASRSDSTMSVAQVEDAPFFKEGLVTYRASPQVPQDHQLKKYIQLVIISVLSLEKSPTGQTNVLLMLLFQLSRKTTLIISLNSHS